MHPTEQLSLLGMDEPQAIAQVAQATATPSAPIPARQRKTVGELDDQLALLEPEPEAREDRNRKLHPDVAARARRAQAVEALGSWRMLRLHTGRKIIEPGSIVYALNGAQMVVCRVVDPIPGWATATLECLVVRGDFFAAGNAAVTLLNNPEKFLKGKTLQRFQSSEVWEFEPPVEARKVKAKPAPVQQMSTRRLEQFIQEWLINGEKLDNAFARKSLRAMLKEQDRFGLNVVYGTTQKKVDEIAKAFDETVDQGEFDHIFWKLLEAIAYQDAAQTQPKQVAQHQARPRSS